MMTLERKQDTREKIQLGGLVKKAGLGDLSTATLYGLLLEAAEQLKSNDGKKMSDHWQTLGDLTLSQEEQHKQGET